MTQPTPDPTLAELNQSIIDASRALTAAIRAYPRDQARIDAARQSLEDLRALKASLYPSA
jgi:hypothetical protein